VDVRLIGRLLRREETMRNEPLRVFIAAAAFCLGTAAGVAFAQERWATYANPRFGTSADYPAHLFTRRDHPPGNGDGQSFRTADGRARLTIFGTRNIDDDTPETYLAKFADLAGTAVAMRRVTARYYVLSGTRGGDIFYDRCNFPAAPDDIIDCLTITYPAQEKAAWDAVVTRMSRSLRAGRGLEPR
jgi:hypothetical protein